MMLVCAHVSTVAIGCSDGGPIDGTGGSDETDGGTGGKPGGT
jgi:hypothetical protein